MLVSLVQLDKLHLQEDRSVLVVQQEVQVLLVILCVLFVQSINSQLLVDLALIVLQDQTHLQAQLHVLRE